MAPLREGHVNGHAISYSQEIMPSNLRFSDIPSAIDISVQGADDEDTVEVDLDNLLDDPTELCTLLENEGADRSYWLMVALAYAKQHKPDRAIEMLNKGLNVSARSPAKEKLSLLTCLCWLYLQKSRTAPRMTPGMLMAHPPQLTPHLHTTNLLLGGETY